MEAISIVIPVWNEKGNIRPLIRRIHLAMTRSRLRYEAVIVDDRSTDGSYEDAVQLTKSYPLRVIRKSLEQPRGKAESLMLGFAQCRSDIIVMLDGDLQYPPESIPAMITAIGNGADIVVADRVIRDTSRLRQLSSVVFRTVFGKLLHGFDCDVQSGMKAFRREVLSRMDIRPTAWMFDLPFLLYARNAGYSIRSIPIRFSERHAGREKISLLRATCIMIWESIRLRLAEKRTVPLVPDNRDPDALGFHYRGRKFIHYSRLPVHQSAFFRMTRRQTVLTSTGLLLILLALILGRSSALIGLVGLLTLFYFTDLVFTAYLLYRTLTGSSGVDITDAEVAAVSETGLPVYTVFCPLYKEWRVIPQFLKAMGQLDYPKDKLQVMLLLEEDDTDSVRKISAMDLPGYVETRIIPDGRPKTKPKALNYGLRFARGEFSVIYDAEDIPDPEQLKKSVLAFSRLPRNTVCVQAKLNFYNPDQNLITRIFTAEYALWFDLVLPGLQSLSAPIPLGGTSNHFRTDDLKTLNGWDAFNVTEDCDLGMRIARRGLTTAIINSDTMEEANSRAVNWLNQRSRWIKGYIQTYLVHTRRQNGDTAWESRRDRFIFQLTVGGKVLSMFINPFMWTITVSYFTIRPLVGQAIEALYPAPVLYMGVLCLVFGNFLYMYMYMIGCAKKNLWDLVKYAYITPLYWLGMSLAAWRAVYEMAVNPHYWSKTVHGFHLSHRTASRKNKSVKFRPSFSLPLFLRKQVVSLIPDRPPEKYRQ